jgi:hypothetical protein
LLSTTPLAEAHRVDEVKDIRDKAVALQAYAHQAKDRELIEHATEIRLRAERRAGELLAEMKERGERETKGGDRKSKSQPATLIASPPKLSDLGVTKTQSSRWQQLAGMDTDTFEERIESAKHKALNVLDRVVKGGSADAPRKPAHTAREAKARALQDVGPGITSEVARLNARIDELLAERRRLEIAIEGYKSEIAALKEHSARDCYLDELRRMERPERIAELGNLIIEANVLPQDLTGSAPHPLDIPEYLRRANGGAT